MSNLNINKFLTSERSASLAVYLGAALIMASLYFNLYIPHTEEIRDPNASAAISAGAMTNEVSENGENAQVNIPKNPFTGYGTQSIKLYRESAEKAAAERNVAPNTTVKTDGNGVITAISGSTDGTACVAPVYGDEKLLFVSPNVKTDNSITTLILPDTVTAVLCADGNFLDTHGAFYKNAKLTRFLPSENLVYIGNKSFFGAQSLQYAFIPYRTRHIGDYAFAYCSSLESIYIHGDTSVGDGAFAGSTKLSEVFLSDRVTRVGLGAFEHTPFFDNLTEEYGICGDILLKYNGNAENITIPDGVRIIADGTFAGRLSVKSVHLPKSVEYIGNSAFRSCAKLMNVTFESTEKMPSIGENAFDGCISLSQDSLQALEALNTESRNIIATETQRSDLTQNRTAAVWLYDTVFKDSEMISR